MCRGTTLGKIDAPLDEELESVEWGEYKIEDVLQWQSKREIDPLKLKKLKDETEMMYPFYGQSTVNNGIISYHQLKNKVLNNKNGKPTILIHSNKQNIVYLETPFYLKDGHGATSVLQSENLNKLNQMFIITLIDKIIKRKYSFENKATKTELKSTVINFPIKNGKIDFDFMERFVIKLELTHIAELEAKHTAELDALLLITGLKNYTLTTEEQFALENVDNIEWKSFNLEKLFGKSTRGKRLKSTDRILGSLPFVTAGEVISSFIGNNVDVFSENTITIDMFGSAKYRNYKYGCDDHVTVLHTENLSKLASIFVTTAIHKISYNGQFNYGRNFNTKDADALNILLPTKQHTPDYILMETLITATQKMVIKDVVFHADKKIVLTKSLIEQT